MTKPAWSKLPTESRNPRSRGLDRLSTPRVVALLLEEDRRALDAAVRVAPAVALPSGARLGARPQLDEPVRGRRRGEPPRRLARARAPSHCR